MASINQWAKRWLVFLKIIQDKLAGQRKNSYVIKMELITAHNLNENEPVY